MACEAEHDDFGILGQVAGGANCVLELFASHRVAGYWIVTEGKPFGGRRLRYLFCRVCFRPRKSFVSEACASFRAEAVRPSH